MAKLSLIRIGTYAILMFAIISARKEQYAIPVRLYPAGWDFGLMGYESNFRGGLSPTNLPGFADTHLSGSQVLRLAEARLATQGINVDQSCFPRIDLQEIGDRLQWKVGWLTPRETIADVLPRTTVTVDDRTGRTSVDTMSFGDVINGNRGLGRPRSSKAPSVEDAFRSNFIVLCGYVTQSRRVGRRTSNGGFEWLEVFEVGVERVYKGPVRKSAEFETPAILFGDHGFKIGGYYLIYGSGQSPYRVDPFGRSKPWVDAEESAGEGSELTELGKLQESLAQPGPHGA